MKLKENFINPPGLRGRREPGADRPPPPSGNAARRPLAPRMIADLLRIVDVFGILCVGFAIYLAYVYPSEPETLPHYLAALLLAGLLASILFNDFEVYRGDFLFTRTLRADRVLLTWVIALSVLLAVAFALKVSDQYSRVWAGAWAIGSGGFLLAARLALGRWIARRAGDGGFALRTVVVGRGAQAEKLVRHLRTHDPLRTNVIGIVDPNDANPRPSDAAASREPIGDLAALLAMIRRGDVEQVYLAMPWSEVDQLRSIAHELALTAVTIRVAPDLAGFDYLGKAVTDVAGLTVIQLLDHPISGWSSVLKTLEDRLLAGLALLVFALPMGLIALLIRCESRGPVLFRQRRQGFNDNTFDMLKFRTMYQEAADPAASMLVTKGDPRVTRVGRVLRRTSLDELPQIFNVLKGDMSLVGPRPHALAASAEGHLYGEIVERYAARHRVKPGITGWAQVNGWRGETDTLDKLRQRVEHDLYYIEHWSLWLDFVIIAQTTIALFQGKNAY